MQEDFYSLQEEDYYPSRAHSSLKESRMNNTKSCSEEKEFSIGKEIPNRHSPLYDDPFHADWQSW